MRSLFDEVCEPQGLQVCEVQLSYKRTIKYDFDKVCSAAAVYGLKDSIYPAGVMEYREYFFALFLDRAAKVLGVLKVAEGCTASCPVDAKMIMQGAILGNASAIVLIHNHPSGELRPSSQDEAVTRKLVDAAKLFDMRVVDHLIFTENGYYSFVDHGKL